MSGLFVSYSTGCAPEYASVDLAAAEGANELHDEAARAAAADGHAFGSCRVTYCLDLGSYIEEIRTLRPDQWDASREAAMRAEWAVAGEHGRPIGIVHVGLVA